MQRSEQLARLSDSSESWDIVVIGGGATGLGVAVDAASRGYRTALVEQADFSEGTSSKSTKLVHGGVRYLRGGEVSLVRESLRERGRLLRNAPGLVEPLAFVVPAYRWYERFYYGSGLTLYDMLAGRLGIESTGHLSRDETIGRIPNLRPEGLHGGTLYWDGQFDDARLAVALARTAAELGAAVANRVRVGELVHEGGKVRGVVAADTETGEEYRLDARVVVNATGVFSDSIRSLDGEGDPETIAPSQGIHIVLDGTFLGGDTAVMIPKTDDGRVLFAIPWQGRTVVGTTDTAGVPIELAPRARTEEVDYLVEHAGRYLVREPARDDVRAVFAGLRPLVRPGGANAGNTSKISRSHQLSVSGTGLVTIAGGKWTTFRQMAEDTVDEAARVGNLEGRACVTADLALSGGEKREETGERYDPELPCTPGDVRRAVGEEMALSAADVLARRTRCLFLDAARTLSIAPAVIAEMASLSGKDAVWEKEELARFERELDDYRLPTSQRPSEFVSEGS